MKMNRTGEPATKAHIGRRVSVFNQLGDNFTGVITAINKRTARVRPDAKYRAVGIFANHRSVYRVESDCIEFLVPFNDCTLEPLTQTPRDSI